MIDLNPFKNEQEQYEYQDRHNDKKSISGLIVWLSMISFTLFIYSLMF